MQLVVPRPQELPQADDDGHREYRTDRGGEEEALVDGAQIMGGIVETDFLGEPVIVFEVDPVIDDSS